MASKMAMDENTGANTRTHVGEENSDKDRRCNYRKSAHTIDMVQRTCSGEKGCKVRYFELRKIGNELIMMVDQDEYVLERKGRRNDESCS